MLTRQDLFRLAFYPAHTDFGTPYPCDPQHLASYRQLPGPNRQRQVSALEAMQELVSRNSELRCRGEFRRSERAAMKRLTAGVEQSAELGWGPDLIVKMFADLDLVFFNGKLLGNVCIFWQILSPIVVGDTLRLPGNQARIRLNPQQMFLSPHVESPFKAMFSAMLHEMCHAYEFIRCPPLDGAVGNGHDANFRTRIHAVHRRAYDCLGVFAIRREDDYFYHHHMSDDWADERGGGPLGPRDDGDPLPVVFVGNGVERVPMTGPRGLTDMEIAPSSFGRHDSGGYGGAPDNPF